MHLRYLGRLGTLHACNTSYRIVPSVLACSWAKVAGSRGSRASAGSLPPQQHSMTPLVEVDRPIVLKQTGPFEIFELLRLSTFGYLCPFRAE